MRIATTLRRVAAASASRAKARHTFAMLVASAWLTGACRERVEPQGPSHPRTTVPDRSSGAGFDAGGSFVEHQLAMRVARLGGGLEPVGPPSRGTLAQGSAASHGFETIAGHCYRILAVGGVEANDLDLVLYDGSGAELDADTDGRDYPSLGTTRPICPATSVHLRVEVRMIDGQGEYALLILTSR